MDTGKFRPLLHDLGLTERYSAQERFEVDGANAARSFLKERGIPAHQIQLVWDAIALHTTRSIALHKEPEVAMTHSGIFVDVLGAGLELIPQEKLRAILVEFPRLSMRKRFLDCLCGVVRRKPATSYDNSLRDLGTRYVEGYAAPTLPIFSKMHLSPNNLILPQIDKQAGAPLAGRDFLE